MNKQEQVEEQKAVGKAAVGLVIIFLITRLLDNFIM